MNQGRQNQVCLSLEGNIGAGKSTFLKILEGALNVQVVFEPHDKWQKVGDSGENILDKFYRDTTRWAYTFQTYAFVTRVLEQETAARINKHQVQILERSVFSDRYCFAKNCYELGTMNALEWKLYQEWFSWLVNGYTAQVAGCIYLQTTPEVCHKRLVKRNRSEESSVSLEYLQSIHQKHERWLVEKREVDEQMKETPVLILECNTDFESNLEEQAKHITKICDFFDITARTPFQSPHV